MFSRGRTDDVAFRVYDDGSRSPRAYIDSKKLHSSNRPFIVDDTDKIPLAVFLLEHEPQTGPIHSTNLWIEAGEMILDGDRLGVRRSNVAESRPMAHDLAVIADVLSP